MGLARNLRKTLNDWVDKILVELSCHYIKHLARQTTKKQDNSSPTTSSQNPLTTENQRSIIATSSQDTSERTTMTGQEPVDQARAWAIQRVQEMNTADNTEQIYDRLALMDEWYEWFDLDKMDGMDYLVLEDVTEESEL